MAGELPANKITFSPTRGGVDGSPGLAAGVANTGEKAGSLEATANRPFLGSPKLFRIALGRTGKRQREVIQQANGEVVEIGSQCEASILATVVPTTGFANRTGDNRVN